MRSLRYTLAFLGLGLALPATGWVLLGTWPVPALGFAVAGGSFLLMSLGYGALGPALFRKRADGTLPPGTWLLLGPFLALVHGTWHLVRWFRRGPAFGVLLPRVYLGRRLTEREARQAVELGWVGVLDLAAEFAEVPALRTLPRYRSLPLLDATAPTPEELASALRWLREVTAIGPVYVHCAEGHGRTGTVLLAYLLAEGLAGSVKEGLARLRTVRPGLRINREQRAALEAAQRQGLLGPAPSNTTP